jgi:hypothetical protein
MMLRPKEDAAMRVKWMFVVFALLGGALVSQAADNVPPDEFCALFNGRDFTGWQASRGRPETDEARAKWQQHWTIEDGTIKFDGQGPDLWTSGKYKDFVLLVDWRLPRPGDSGIYLRGQSKSQVNIWVNRLGSGEVWGYRTDAKQPEEVRQACTPSKAADKPVGEWNTFKITVKGDRLTVDLNGETVIQNAQLPNVPPEGEIALQRHGDPIEFKNIFVKELPSE